MKLNSLMLTLIAFFYLASCGPADSSSSPSPSPSASASPSADPSATATPTAAATTTPTPIPTSTPTPTPTNKKIFVTTSTANPQLGGSAAAALTAADAACMADASKPAGGGTYKALLASSARTACTSANCVTSGSSEHVGWVLQASTTYYRADGTTAIGTTTAAGIFTFPLTASISAASTSYISGFATDWTTSDNCTAWTDGSAMSSFRTGYAAGTSSAAIDMGSGSTTPCNQATALVCVEQ